MSQIQQAQAPVFADYGGQNSPQISFGSAPPQGSLILLAIFANENSGAVTINSVPSGFTKVQDQDFASAVHVWLYYKIAGASEPTTYQVFLNRNTCCCLIGANYTGVDTSTVLDANATNNGTDTQCNTGSTPTASSVAERYFSIIGCQGNKNQFTSPSDGFSTLLTGGRTATGGAGNESVTYGLFTKDMPGPSTGPASMHAFISSSANYSALVATFRELPHTPVTWAKTGALVAGGTALSGPKGRTLIKTGSVVGDMKAVGQRSGTRAKTGTLISDGAAFSGFRPAFYGKKGALIIPGVVSGAKINFRGATITRITTDFVHGIAAAQVATTGSGPYQGAYTEFTPTQTDPHTASVWLRATVPIRLRIATAAGVTIATSPTIAPTGNWALQSLTPGAALINGTKYRFFIETTQAVATAFFIDAAQVEVGEVASPFTVGSRPSGGGPVGDVIREQKPAGLLGQYLVIPGSPGIWATYQVLYDNHPDYEEVLDSKQTYKQVYTNPGP
jgi:hypothetical protein